MYILISIFVFGMLIAIHELGHFIAAKLCGVRVFEFAVGMGPAIIKKQGKETLYSLRLFPAGGYCAMEEDVSSDDPNAFTNQPMWKRLIILAAGAAMNFIFGILIILLLFSQSDTVSVPRVSGFMDGCPYEGDILTGDIFYKIDGERIYFSSNVSQIMSRNTTGVFDVVLRRDGQFIRLDDYKMEQREYVINGESQYRYGLYFSTEEATFFSRVKFSWYCALDYLRLVRMSLADLLTGAFGIKDLSGPVGIINVMTEVGKNSVSVGDAATNILNFTAFIFINIAFMNMLPLPALDGGRILFMLITVAIERISKRKLDPKYEGYIHAAGLVLLLGLSVFVLFNDIMRIIHA